MNIYGNFSKAYSLLDRKYFSEKGSNPREVIKGFIPNREVRILDMCCGTLCNTLDIAKEKTKVEVIGVDLSEDMLMVAREKVKENQLDNVKLKCIDATNTALPSRSFDYVIIGLVLHEISPSLADGMIKEARRILKEDGSLIILEWEAQHSLRRKIKYAPVYWLEILNSRTFAEFYTKDKVEYFRQYGFVVKEQYHCNYSIVLRLENE